MSDTDWADNFKEIEPMETMKPIESLSGLSTTIVIVVVLCVIGAVVGLVVAVCCCVCKRAGYSGSVYRQAPQHTTTTAVTTSYAQPPAPSYLANQPAPYYPNQPAYLPQQGYQQQTTHYPPQNQPLMAAGGGYPPQGQPVMAAGGGYPPQGQPVMAAGGGYPPQGQPVMAAGGYSSTGGYPATGGYPPQNQSVKMNPDAPPTYTEATMQKASAPPPEY